MAEPDPRTPGEGARTARPAPGPNLPQRIAATFRHDVPLVMLDAAAVFVAYFVPFALAREGTVAPDYWNEFWVFFPFILLVHLLANYFFGLYGQMWRFASVEEARRVVLASATAAPIVYVANWVVRLDEYMLPRSVVLLGAALSLTAIGAIRFQSRLFGFRRREFEEGVRRVLIAGAGEAGAMVLQDVQRNPQLGLDPVAIVDDDPRKLGRELRGVRIKGPVASIPQLVPRLDVDEVLLAIPSASSALVQEVAALCEDADVAIRVLPSRAEVLGGVVTARDIRDLRIEDLLGRSQVETDLEEVGAMLRGRTVLVTGAGGSIGSEIARQVRAFDPECLLVLDHDETHLHDLLLDVGDACVVPLLGDVRDRDRVLEVFERYEPDVVFHAAAHKHVPLLEVHPQEALLTNVIGTANVADAALAFGAERFVLISTDKAVNTANVMGASKWFAEQVVRSFEGAPCVYSSVRFGNVLGSRGSVIPTFLRQISRGGPVTVTDPEMTRYFMSVGEAVQLVLQAAALARGGEVFTLEMGAPMNILELARRVIRLSGRAPGSDVEIRVVGPRPGEKTTEELLADGEDLLPSAHPSIRIARGARPRSARLRSAIRELETLARSGTAEALGERMKELANDREPALVAAGGGA